MSKYEPIRVLPVGWTQISSPIGGWAYGYRDGLRVLVSTNTERDGREWLHVSCSCADRLPPWSVLKWVKTIFIGRDKVAIQVLPKESEYVNTHPHVLHLWHCLDGDVIPNFALDGMI